MKKSIAFLLVLWGCGISDSFASFKVQDFGSEFEKMKQNVSILQENIQKLELCFDKLPENKSIGLGVVAVFEKISEKANQDKNFKYFLDTFVTLLCDEKENTIGLLSVNAIQKQLVNPLIFEFLQKSKEKTWGDCFKEVCSIEKEEYFEIFKLPYNQLLLEFFFCQGIPHDFYFSKSSLYAEIVSGPQTNLSIKLLRKHENF